MIERIGESLTYTSLVYGLNALNSVLHFGRLASVRKIAHWLAGPFRSLFLVQFVTLRSIRQQEALLAGTDEGPLLQRSERLVVVPGAEAGKGRGVAPAHPMRNGAVICLGRIEAQDVSCLIHDTLECAHTLDSVCRYYLRACLRGGERMKALLDVEVLPKFRCECPCR